MSGLLEKCGFRIRTYDSFMSSVVDFHGLDGTPNLTATELRQHYDTVREALRKRASAFDGSHVVYDPNDDEDGWLLVGDENEIRTITEQMIREA